MRIINFLRIFRSQDQIFFNLFEKVADTLVKMSKTFHEGILDFDINDETFLNKLSDLEHQNDSHTHEIFIELGKKPITPFDHEDIHSLASGLDDIADYIYASAKYIYLYKSPETKAYSEFSILIMKVCEELHNAIINLKGFKNTETVKESLIKINSIENIADDLLSQYLVKIFDTEDAINIIKIKTVLDYLETVTDKAEDAANTIETILIKYT